MADQFLDFLDTPEPEVLDGELVAAPAKAIAKKQADRLRLLEDEILEEATETIIGALKFSKIDPESKEPPKDWIAALGPERAAERFRLAKYALMDQKNAPVGMKIATNVHASITRARQTEKAGSRALNVTLVQMPAAHVEYPRLEVGERK